MENKIVVDDIPLDYYKKQVGSGVMGRCYLTSDNKVFKEFIESYNGISTFDYLAKTKYDFFVFPELLIYVKDYNDERLAGYIMPFVSGCDFNNLDGNIKVRDFIEALKKLEFQIRAMSSEILIEDMNPGNMIYNSSNNSIFVVDTDLYIRTPHDPFRTFKENIKELASSTLRLIDGAEDLSFRISQIIRESSLYGIMLPSTIYREVTDDLEKRFDDEIKTLDDLYHGISLVRKR